MATATPGAHNAIDPACHAPPAAGSPILRRQLPAWRPATSAWDTVRNDLPSTRATYKRSGLAAGPNCAYRLRFGARLNLFKSSQPQCGQHTPSSHLIFSIYARALSSPGNI